MLETLELDGKSIIVTGGGRGLGRAMALAMAEAGAQIAIASRTEAQIDSVVAEITAAGGEAIGIPTDVTDSEQVNALVARTVEAFGKLDGMFANAGIGGGTNAEFWEYPDWAFEEVLAVNLKSTFYSGRAAAKHYVGDGLLAYSGFKAFTK